MQDFSDKTLRLESISLLISAVLRFSRESYFIKAIENFFPVFAQPDINTRGVGRILDSYANTENVFYCLNNVYKAVEYRQFNK